EVLPTVNDPAVLELEDDAVVNVQVLAVSVCGAALNANHTGVPHCSHMLQLSPKGPSGLLRELTEVRQGCPGALVIAGHRAPARQVPHGLVHELGERVHIARVERLVGASHDRYVLLCSHREPLRCRARVEPPRRLNLVAPVPARRLYTSSAPRRV